MNRPSLCVTLAILLVVTFVGLPLTSSAQKPKPRSPLEIIPNEQEESYQMTHMRVSKASGAPLALYRVNYAVAAATPLDMARQYLRENSGLLRINNDLSGLQHTTTRETPGGYHVRFLQHIGGYPVYRGDIVVNINRENQVTFVMNGYKPLAGLSNTTPSITLDDAQRIAETYLDVQGRIHHKDRNTVVYYNKGVTRLAHRVVIVPAEDKIGDWELLIDAHSGEIFRVEDKALNATAATTTGSGWVFDPDPLTRARATYQTGGQFGDNNDADTDSLVAQIVQRDLRDIEYDGTYHLTGPYAEIVDIESPFNGLFSRADSIWHFTRNPSGFEAANVYFHLDQSMRYINETLGFSLMPFQYTGGVKGDPHGFNGEDNSHYLPSTGELAWGEGGVDDAEDEDVILHELGHGLHDWITDGNLSQVQGLSEGCGDYWANSYNRSTGFWTPADPQYYWVFQWDGHNQYWAGRITNYSAHYPDGLTGTIHTDGQIWASTLMQIWEDIGKTATDSDFLEALSMTNGSSNQQDAAEAFIQADVDLFGGAHLGTIGYWFTERGYVVTIPTPSITHVPLSDSEDVFGPYSVSADVIAANPVDTVLLIYGTGGAFTDTLEMVYQGINEYEAAIPGTGVAADYNYYIFAADSAGLASTHPVGAPGSFHSFHAGPDVTPPSIVHTPLGNQAYLVWPATVQATITDNLGVDTAWVEYSVNGGAVTGSFPLVNTSGDIYSGTFDIDTTVVAIGDVVDYRVAAEDVSAASNQAYHPAAGYHTFEITDILGMVLIIDDDASSGQAVFRSEKGDRVRDLEQNPYGKSATDMESYLVDAGYLVVVETPASTDPGTWTSYDLIISSSGISTTSLSNTTYRNALIAHAQAGKKYIVEGGEVGYTWRDNISITRYVIHADEWNGDNEGALNLLGSQADHPIATAPNLLPSSIGITYTGYGSEDAMTPTDSYVIYEPTLEPGDAGIAVFDDNTNPLSAQCVYYALNFAQITDQNVARSLLENTVTYLLTPEVVNTRPVVAQAIPDTTVANGAMIVGYRDLNDVFTDAEEGSELAFSIQSNSNPAVVTVTINADSALDIGVDPVASGTATIVVRATDSESLFIEDSFDVMVTPASYTLTANSVGGGIVVKTPDQPSYVYNDTVVVEAVPDPNWNFSVWSDGLSGSLNPDTIVIVSDTTVTAIFVPDTFLVTVATDPAGREVMVDSVTYTAPRQFMSAFGAAHDIEAVSPQDDADTVYVFSHWSDSLAIAHTIVVPDSNPTFTAYFDRYFKFASIDSIVDIPGDQGGWVNVHFARSWLDSEDEMEYPIDRYKLWRLLSAPSAATQGQLPPGTWVAVDSVAASQQDHYTVAVPTPEDSSDTALPLFTYVVSAHTSTASVWFAGSPDSGYSVDNIAPAAPEGLTAAYNTGSGNHLSWTPSADSDFREFRVYRESDLDFTPSPDNRVDIITAAEWFDPEYDGWAVYYKISTVDTAGNESDPSAPGTATAVEAAAVPNAFALGQNHPNPFNPATMIRYDVPAGGGSVEIRIYDVGGRLVRTLVDGAQAAGQKRILWNGRDNRGEDVASGVYFYRMTAPGFEKTRKMVLLR